VTSFLPTPVYFLWRIANEICRVVHRGLHRRGGATGEERLAGDQLATLRQSMGDGLFSEYMSAMSASTPGRRSADASDDQTLPLPVPPLVGAANVGTLSDWLKTYGRPSAVTFAK
jgi:hypothetical protein